MLTAGLWGLLGGSSLLLGAVVGLWLDVSQRVIGLVMAFGAGVLISAVAFELTSESYRTGGAAAVIGGLAAGAVAFYLADLVIDRRGGHARKRSGGQQAEGSAPAIVVGALMDGIPESVAIGASLLGGGQVGVAVVAAVFLSNMPESMSAATGMRRAGARRSHVLWLWVGVTLITGVAAAVGYGVLGEASPVLLAGMQAFAAGAILTMLADTMMPEAFEHGGSTAGLVTVLGFTSAFMLSTLE
ncbi:MAG: ZIP family metal transporter [Thermoleophilaceae bacterium]